MARTTGKDDIFAKQFLKGLLGNYGVARPATLYVALFTVSPDGTNPGTEVASGGQYARKPLTNNGTNWAYTAPNIIKNAVGISWSQALSFAFGNITAWGLFPAATGTGLMWFGPITPPTTINIGDVAALPVGALTITED